MTCWGSWQDAQDFRPSRSSGGVSPARHPRWHPGPAAGQPGDRGQRPGPGSYRPHRAAASDRDRLSGAARWCDPQPVGCLDQRRGVPGLPAVAAAPHRALSLRPGTGRGPGRDRAACP